MAGQRLAAVGVDFGTSTSFVASRGGNATDGVLKLGSGRRYLASLAGQVGGVFVVGEEAEALTPDRVLRSVKRAITDDQTSIRVGGRDGEIEVARDEVLSAI